MIPSRSHLRLCIFINLAAVGAFYNGHPELGAVALYAGLCQFQCYLLRKHIEDKEKQ